jgi:hypothetical protein
LSGLGVGHDVVSECECDGKAYRVSFINSFRPRVTP